MTEEVPESQEVKRIIATVWPFYYAYGAAVCSYGRLSSGITLEKLIDEYTKPSNWWRCDCGASVDVDIPHCPNCGEKRQ